MNIYVVRPDVGEQFKLLNISLEMSTTIAPLSLISEEKRDEIISIIQGNVHVNTVVFL